MAEYIIVGAGAFGASTALYLAETEPQAKIVLVERTSYPCPSAAASDLNKIVRADYRDLFDMRLALEALEKWKQDPLYKPYFHSSGMLLAEDFGMGRGSYDNFKKLGVDTGAEILSPDQAREKFPNFKNANWTGVEDCYYNPSAGWGDANGSMRAVTKAALAAGVEYVQASVERLIFDSQGSCIGIKTDSGDEITGQSILLCAGAWTAKLIADSAPDNKAIQVDGRMIAAAATSCVMKCDPDHLPLYRNAPVHILSMPHTRGESIPTTSDGKLKFNFETSFTNKVYHEASGQTISVPPAPVGQSTWSHEIPEQLKRDVRKVVKHIYGQDAPGLTVEAYRMCWDSITPNQDFIISPHTACKGLFIASGGSFHSWKFLPIIGKYVTLMMKGQLSSEQAKKWAWDRENQGATMEVYIPKNDLKDFEGFEASM